MLLLGPNDIQSVKILLCLKVAIVKLPDLKVACRSSDSCWVVEVTIDVLMMSAMTDDFVYKHRHKYECWDCVVLYHRYELAAASFKVCLQSYLSPDVPTADNSRESSPLHMTSTRTVKVTLLQKNQELNARDANVVSFMVRQVSFSIILTIVFISEKDITCEIIHRKTIYRRMVTWPMTSPDTKWSEIIKRWYCSAVHWRTVNVIQVISPFYDFCCFWCVIYTLTSV